MPGNPSSSITTGEPSSPSEPSPSSEPRPSSEPSPSSERRPSSEPSPSSERRRGLAAVARPVERSPGLLPRLGLAILHPRWALAIAADRRYAGRSGSDLIAALLLMLAATQLRGLATAVWLGGALDLGLGLRAAIHVLTRALTVDLGLLVVGALVLYALAGSRRNLGRAFDLMCVAALPLLFVELAATVTVQTAGFSAPPVVRWLLSGVSCAWMGALIALAIRPARTAPMRVPAPPR
ncbi:MAG TPA: hypothetical protein VFK02_23350, partial [Kofleriaceae bacterium]|nr:hypothetical protein [Kofleriaceae bacterium]